MQKNKKSKNVSRMESTRKQIKGVQNCGAGDLSLKDIHQPKLSLTVRHFFFNMFHLFPFLTCLNQASLAKTKRT